MVSLPIFRLLFTANLILMTQNRLEIGRLWTIFQMFRLLFTTNLLLMTKNWSEIGRFWTILYRIAVESKNHLKFQKKWLQICQYFGCFSQPIWFWWPKTDWKLVIFELFFIVTLLKAKTTWSFQKNGRNFAKIDQYFGYFSPPIRFQWPSTGHFQTLLHHNATNIKKTTRNQT